MNDKQEVLKLINDFYNCDEYEGSNLDSDLKDQLTKYIYEWYQNNLDKFIGNNKRKSSVKCVLSKYIVKKIWEGSSEETFKIEKELEDDLDLIIEGRLMQDIDYNEDIFELSPKKGLTLNVKYKTISNSFKALSTYMIENDMDKDFTSGLMKFIPEKTSENLSSETVSNLEKEKSEDTIDVQKMFFFNSSSFDGIKSCVFYDGGCDIVSPEVSAMTLQNYIINHNYKSKAEIIDDCNIQFQNDDMLEKVIEKYGLSFDKKNLPKFKPFTGVKLLEGEYYLAKDAPKDYSTSVEKTKAKK